MVIHIARIIGSSMVWECCTSKPAIWSRRIYPAWRQMRKSAVRWWVALDTESCAYIGPGHHWTTAYVTRRCTPIACILMGMVHTPTLCASSLTEIARCSTSRRCGLCATSNQRPSGVWCSLCCAPASKKHSSIPYPQNDPSNCPWLIWVHFRGPWLI